jgi:preprotein translocase subunit YajC
VGYLIILIALFAALWLFLIRPQRRRQVEATRMQDDLAAGDKILTAGGIHGTVRGIEDEVVQLEIAPGTIVRLDRRAVAAVEPEETELEAEEIEAEPEDSPSPGES